jgi:thioredoxin-like negative regulator of GroEL
MAITFFTGFEWSAAPGEPARQARTAALLNLARSMVATGDVKGAREVLAEVRRIREA